MSKSPRQKAIAYADEQFSLYVRERDGRCINCNSRFQLTNGHLFPRARMGTRWEERNGNCQCVFCNSNHEIDPDPYKQWYIEKYGEASYESLERASFTPCKFTVQEIREIGDKYKAKRKTLKEIYV